MLHSHRCRCHEFNTTDPSCFGRLAGASSSALDWHTCVSAADLVPLQKHSKIAEAPLQSASPPPNRCGGDFEPGRARWPLSAKNKLLGWTTDRALEKVRSREVRLRPTWPPSRPCQGLPSAGVLGGRSSTLQRPAATQVCPPRAEVATPRSPVVPSSIRPSSPRLISTLSLSPPLTPLPPSQALGGIVDGLSSARFILACGLFWELCGPKESPMRRIARCICWVYRFWAELPHVCSCFVLQ